MPLKSIFQIGLIIFTVICCAQTESPGKNQTHQLPGTRADSEKSTAFAGTKDEYPELLKRIGRQRLKLQNQFNNAATDAERQLIIDAGRKYIISVIADSLIPCWYGTPWDFYGQTQKPNQGSIACGYFVSTILKHAGFQVERTLLAQQASELIIKSLTSEKYIKRFSNIVITDFIEKIKNAGAGLFIVGLDYHTGFLYNDGSGIYFLHSAYLEPLCVVRESALKSVILSASAYRVTGKITDDDALIRKWLKGTAISTRRR